MSLINITIRYSFFFSLLVKPLMCISPRPPPPNWKQLFFDQLAHIKFSGHVLPYKQIFKDYVWEFFLKAIDCLLHSLVHPSRLNRVFSSSPKLLSHFLADSCIVLPWANSWHSYGRLKVLKKKMYRHFLAKNCKSHFHFATLCFRWSVNTSAAVIPSVLQCISWGPTHSTSATSHS